MLDVEVKGRIISPGEVRGFLLEFSDYNFKKYSDEYEIVIWIINNLSTDIVTELLGTGKVYGVVSLNGGIVSHGAALLRERKVPCIAVNDPAFVLSYTSKFAYLKANEQKIEIFDNRS